MTTYPSAYLHIHHVQKGTNRLEEVKILGHSTISMSDTFPPFIGEEARQLLCGEKLLVGNYEIYLYP